MKIMQQNTTALSCYIIVSERLCFTAHILVCKCYFINVYEFSFNKDIYRHQYN